MDDLTLHEMHLSGNCYKIRLTASLLKLKLKLIEHDLLNGATRTPKFTANINANGRIPVLQVGDDTFLPESGAACYYLADIAGSDLIPSDKFQHAQMLQWMFFEQYSHEPVVAVLRFWRVFIGLENLTDTKRALIPEKERQGREVFDVMENHLGGEDRRDWFVGDRISLADVSLYAYTHRADESGFDLKEWPSVNAWCERVTGVEGYLGLED